jgi:hypothetical protein
MLKQVAHIVTAMLWGIKETLLVDATTEWRERGWGEVERELETETEMKQYQEKEKQSEARNKWEREDKSNKHVNVLLGANIPLSCNARVYSGYVAVCKTGPCQQVRQM